MKLFVILSRFPYPLEKGDKLRAYHQLRELSKQYRIHLCCITDKKIPEEHRRKLEPFCEQVHILRLNRFKILLNLVLGIFSSKAFQYHFFYQKQVHRQVNRLIDRIRPKHIYSQLIRTARYATSYPLIPKTLDYMDALSAGMERRSGTSSFPMNVLYRLEAIRLRKIETYFFDLFDNKTIISERDRNDIEHPQKHEIHVIRNGVDFEFFGPDDRDKDVDLLFTGNMNYPPNVDAAIYLVKSILPSLQNRGMECKILISGANPSPAVQKLAQKNVEVSGWVEDIRDAYARAKVFVAPMFLGSGLQNKLLEAMSMGIPCVSSPIVNESLKAEDGKQILIAEDPDLFADCIVRLLKDTEFAQHLAENGRDYAHSNFKWSDCGQQLAQILGHSSSLTSKPAT